MFTVLSCITVQHDFSLVVLAAVICLFGSWVTSRLHRYARNRSHRQSISWHLLSALTAGISIWCTHFVAMLGFRPEVPVNFELVLTFASLLIAILGSGLGIMFAAMSNMRHAPLIGGAILGLAISGMHYAGMIAYRVQGLVSWQLGFLVVSIALAVLFSSIALYYGSKGRKMSEVQMTLLLTVAIVSLHFTGMAAFRVAPMDISGEYVNPEALKVLAVAIGGTAILIVLGGLFCYAIENRTRMESIAELTAARNAAESASRAKSEFLSVLSHELRTPLTIVLGYSGMLSKLQETQAQRARFNGTVIEPGANPLVDQAELYGQKISGAASHLLTLINEILDYTSMELGDANLARISFPVDELLSEVADQFGDAAREKSAVLHLESDVIIALADRGRCLQILTNLVGNALKFSKASDIHLRAALESDGFRIEVTDNGCGISEEYFDQIFEAFRQVETADNRKEGGTGLGLAICRKLAMAHGGDVTVRSTLGQGTTFTVSLPASAVDDEATAAANRGEMRMAG